MTKELNIEPSSYPCHILATDFDTGIVSIQMLGDNYKVSSGMKYLSDKPPVKELSRENIFNVILQTGFGDDGRCYADEIYEFANAILRKAQE